MIERWLSDRPDEAASIEQQVRDENPATRGTQILDKAMPALVRMKAKERMNELGVVFYTGKDAA